MVKQVKLTIQTTTEETKKSGSGGGVGGGGETKEEEEEEDDEWKGYIIKCDDLVPPSCDDTLQVTKGRVETLKGVFVTYWKYSNNATTTTTTTSATSHTNKKYPIIVINGGPGLPHNYIKPARSLACGNDGGGGRDVVMYDQAGTGQSWIENEAFGGGDIEDADPTQIPQLLPELLTLNYYAHIELPAILDALGWRNTSSSDTGGEGGGGYHILGESWGTQIAFEYAAHSHPNKPPEGLQSLLMNAPISDNHKFIEYQWDPTDGSVGTLPTYIQDRLKYYNSTNQDFDNEEFETLEDAVSSEFNARIGVVVDCWLETEKAGISQIDYDQLTGRTDIFPAQPGVDLRGWTVLPDLWKLRDYKIPVQLNHGRYDMVRPHLIADTAAALGYNTNNNNAENDDNSGSTQRSSNDNLVECHMLDRAAHSILLDSPLEAYSYIKDFIYRVEEFDGDKNDDEDGRRRFRTVGSCPVPADFEPNTINYDDNGSVLPSSLPPPHSEPSSSSQSKSFDRTTPVRRSRSHHHSHRWRYEYDGDVDGIEDDPNSGGGGGCEITAGRIEWLLSLVVTMVLSFLIGKKVGKRRRHDQKAMYYNKTMSSLCCSDTNGRDNSYQTIPEIPMDASSD
eukprot:CAMPEP_0113462800 /NCGR_PEP_ID=MMETSP0014_2-20120614/12299_1 /TAXON_ID=2857 /ORGANISM="Nitzschia sp." /LENGTH=619 /DNA_ID=CAMNT_0000354715 /DNA_START=147 /DNA_END=2003 /DNA_ORIENTATION=+ /assembly_acc=CAM_ASM_000159